MRQLRVVGLGDDSSTVVLEDPIRHERFAVTGDERLRAAARGDVRRLGQMEIEVTSPLRPRDIQARVRAGESVEQVASGGGVTTAHVERFAYPVLLERARVAELAGRAHPVLDDRTNPRTLGEIVSATFAARGQDYEEARWDAWKGEDHQWVVVLSWQAGRSDNTARWTYQPGPSGGTVVARDDPARDLTGEAPVGPRRMDDRSDLDTSRTEGRTAGPTLDEADEADASASEAEQADLPPALTATGEAAPTRSAPGSSASSSAASSSPTPSPPPSGAGRGGPDRRGRAGRGVPDQRTARRGETPAAPAASTGPTDALSADGAEDPEPARGAKRKNHPIVPSWEDVLLGVRSPRG